MTLPTNRDTFKTYCLRALGAPLIDINVSEDQVDDRIDQALQLYYLYHFNGTLKSYYKHALTSEDITNQYITLPNNYIGAVNIFDMGDALNTNNIFSIRYQIALNDLYTLTSVSMVPYYMALSHLQFLEELLVGRQPVRYNAVQNIFYIDMDWCNVVPGQFLIIEAYMVIDPDTYASGWADPWLSKYAIALIKQNWGEQTKKYGQMKLPGGNFYNGQQIYDEATAEVLRLEEQLKTQWSLPAMIQIG